MTEEGRPTKEEIEEVKKKVKEYERMGYKGRPYLLLKEFLRKQGEID